MAKIKVLFLASNPVDTGRLQLDMEVKAIESKIRASEYRESIDLISDWGVSPDDLIQLLNQHKPHIVHFSGHGSDSEEIILSDINNKSKPVSNEAIKFLFSTLKDNIRVVLLNACYSKSQAEAITEVIDCAIGMSKSIGDQAAIIFAASFYRAIGFNRSVKNAFDQGIAALKVEGISEENTPTLITRTGIDPDHIILIKPPEVEPIPPGTPKEPLGTPKEPPVITSPGKTNWQYQVVGFDIDGTLIRGDNFNYSWKLIWDYLGLPEKTHRQAMRKYLEGKWTYKQWCEWVCGRFKDKGLKRDQFREIVKTLHVTNNFLPTIQRLKNENFTLAIISGSIDTFFDSMVPRYSELFDYTFINQLIFDQYGSLDRVVHTDFDFQGKARALEQICQKVGCSTNQAVYVGEGFNDKYIINAAGLSIAYPPTVPESEIFSNVVIDDDNLELILEHILVCE